jgi:hypothetical protein
MNLFKVIKNDGTSAWTPISEYPVDKQGIGPMKLFNNGLCVFEGRKMWGTWQVLSVGHSYTIPPDNEDEHPTHFMEIPQ